jgi:hypothetical protein
MSALEGKADIALALAEVRPVADLGCSIPTQKWTGQRLRFDQPEAYAAAPKRADGIGVQ